MRDFEPILSHFETDPPSWFRFRKSLRFSSADHFRLHDSAMKWRGRDSVIRQAISCDICGTEMLNANHWFVAYDRGPELRIGAWSAHNRIKASARHLCGHKCLHKLVDNFMAKTLTARATASVETDRSNPTFVNRAAPPTDASLTSAPPRKWTALPIIGSYVEDFESSARIINPAEPTELRPSPAALRAGAWKRERERQRLAEQTAPPRRSIA